MDLSRAGKKTLQVRILATKPEELYLIPRTRTVEEENSHNFSSDLHMYNLHMSQIIFIKHDQ